MSDETEEISPVAKEKMGRELFRIPLRPYSPSRRVASQSMGRIYPFMGAAAKEQLEKTNTYPGQLRDTVIVLWLCSLKDSIDLTAAEVKAGEWTPTRAMNKPEAAFEAAMEWAEPLGMLVEGSDEHEAASQIFADIVTEAERAKFKIAGAESAEGDEGPKV